MTAITLTQQATPAPSVAVSITGLPAGTVSVHVWRSWASQESRVRGDDQLVITGGVALLTDHRVPPGRLVTYRVESYNAAGTRLDVTIAPSLMVAALPDSMAWLMDCEDPGSAMLLPLMAGTDDRRVLSGPGVYSRPATGGDPDWLSGGNRGGASMPFVLRCSTREEVLDAERLLTPNGTLLVRANPDCIIHATGLVFVAAPSVELRVRHPHTDTALLGFDGTSVREDDWPLTVPTRTWWDVKAENGTWNDVKTRYTNWIAVKAG